MPEEEFELESDEAMEFHYFKLHDFNNDNKLDGLELGKSFVQHNSFYFIVIDQHCKDSHFISSFFIYTGAAMTHYHDGGSEGEGRRKQIDLSDDELEMLINQILKDDDLNDDGYVDYYEFVKAQRRAEAGV